MNENRLPDYLEHIQQAAIDALSFVDGLAKEDFLADKRTQQAVIMSLIIIGEAATKIMDGNLGVLATGGKHISGKAPRKPAHFIKMPMPRLHGITALTERAIQCRARD